MTPRRDLRKLASDSLIYGIPGIVLRFLTAFLVPLYTRVFSPAQYGTRHLVTSTVALLLVVTVLALDNSTYRWYYDSEDLSDRKTTFSSWTWAYLLTSLVAGLAVFVTSGWLAQIILGSRAYQYVFQLAAATIPASVLGCARNVAARASSRLGLRAHDDRRLSAHHPRDRRPGLGNAFGHRRGLHRATNRERGGCSGRPTTDEELAITAMVPVGAAPRHAAIRPAAHPRSGRLLESSTSRTATSSTDSRRPATSDCMPWRTR